MSWRNEQTEPLTSWTGVFVDNLQIMHCEHQGTVTGSSQSRRWHSSQENLIGLKLVSFVYTCVYTLSTFFYDLYLPTVYKQLFTIFSFFCKQLLTSETDKFFLSISTVLVVFQAADTLEPPPYIPKKNG